MDVEAAEPAVLNEINDENQGFVEVGRIENDGEVIIVQIENPNVAGAADDDEARNRSQDTNPLEQQQNERSPDDGVLTPNRKKRKRAATPKGKMARNFPDPMKDEDDDGSTCSICLDNWESAGQHRLVSLKCGHLFGESCINRWFKEGNLCPTCKARAKLSDKRPLFAKKVMAIDRTEEVRLEKLLKSESQKNTALELRINTLTLELNLTQERCRLLEQRLNLARETGAFVDLTASSSSTATMYGAGRAYRLSIANNLELAREAGCRALIYGRRTQTLFASQKSSTSLFQGFGVRLINVTGQNIMATNSFMLMSMNQIRDLSLDMDEELIVSASTEKSVKMFSVPNKCQVCTFTPSDNDNRKMWSVTFDKARTKTLYLGSNGGSTYLYDVRNHQSFMNELTTVGDCSPVTSIISVPPTPQITFGGFVVCKLQSLWFYEYTASQEIRATKLIVEGPFMSATYDEETHLFLINARTSLRHSRMRYIVGNLTRVDGVMLFNTINTILGDTAHPVISRCAQIRVGDETLIGAYLQKDLSLALWNARSNTLLHSLKITDVVYDLCPIYTNNRPYLAALSESRCRLIQLNAV